MSIGIIGTGAWGTALAQLLARGGNQVRLWGRSQLLCDGINRMRLNPAYLPDVLLDERIVAASSLDHLETCETVLVVCPAQHLRATVAQLTLHPRAVLLLCAKGIEQGSGMLMAEVVADVAPRHALAILSGPSFAHEVARGLPTGITLACSDEALGRTLVQQLGQPAFRPYWTDDVIGAEVGGAIKNVLAIACGIAQGRALGENARATLITRGMAEMLRFGTARGARRDTLMGLCGLGDLVLTCASAQSRNIRLGMAIGRGEKAATVLAASPAVAEGAATAPVLAKLAAAANIDMPICTTVAAILEGADVSAAIMALLARPYRDESA